MLTFNYIPLINLIEALKIYLPMNVTSELTMIRLKLWNTLSKVESIMMNNHQSPSLPNIKYVLGTHYITLWPQLARCQNINDILQLVCANSSLDDISLLEYLVNVFNIEEAKPVIEEYKEDVEELKMKLRQFLEEQLLKASPLLKCVTIVVDEDTIGSVLNDVQRLSSDVLLPLHVRLHVIRDGASVWKVWKRKSFTGTFDELTAQSKDTMFITIVPAVLKYLCVCVSSLINHNILCVMCMCVHV